MHHELSVLLESQTCVTPKTLAPAFAVRCQLPMRPLPTGYVRYRQTIRHVCEVILGMNLGSNECSKFQLTSSDAMWLSLMQWSTSARTGQAAPPPQLRTPEDSVRSHLYAHFCKSPFHFCVSYKHVAAYMHVRNFALQQQHSTLYLGTIPEHSYPNLLPYKKKQCSYQSSVKFCVIRHIHLVLSVSCLLYTSPSPRD